MKNYLICCSKNWFSKKFPYRKLKNKKFHFITKKNQLTLTCLNLLKPEYIFFTHWHWLVSEKIITNYNCILFHPGPLPIGRGGSPIQNLILKDYKYTPFNALKMVKELDAGPIYLKQKISLKGNLNQIFERIKTLTEKFILEIVYSKELKPKNQNGKPAYFKRRLPEDSKIKQNDEMRLIFDKIRAVDGLDYPRAFIDLGNKRIEFTKAKFKKNEINACVSIKLKTKNQ